MTSSPELKRSDQQLADERAAEAAVLVFDDAVGRAVEAEVEGEAALVAVGQRADGILADLGGVGAAGRVAAVEDEFVAQWDWVAVVAALTTRKSQSCLRADAVQPGHDGPGVRSVVSLESMRGNSPPGGIGLGVAGVLPPAAEPFVGT